MNTATLIALLQRCDPSGTKRIVLDSPENDGFTECGAVQNSRLALDSDGTYTSPWDAESKLAAEHLVTLLR